MVHLVLERPRESVFPVLVQHCVGEHDKRKSRSKSGFWSIAFPIYYAA